MFMLGKHANDGGFCVVISPGENVSEQDRERGWRNVVDNELKIAGVLADEVFKSISVPGFEVQVFVADQEGPLASRPLSERSVA